MLTDVARFSVAFSLSGAVHVAALSLIPSAVGVIPPHSATPLQVQIMSAFPSQSDSEPELSASMSSRRETPIVFSAEHAKRSEALPVLAPVPISANAIRPSSVNTVQDLPAPEQKPDGHEIKVAQENSGESSESTGRLASASKNEGPKKLAAENIQSTPDKALVAPSLVFSAPPDYPEEARSEKRRGRTLLVFQLRPDGGVREIKLLNSSGHEDLDAAAVQALGKWRFNVPASAEGSAWYKYALRFDLR